MGEFKFHIRERKLAAHTRDYNRHTSLPVPGTQSAGAKTRKGSDNLITCWYKV
jgi:hypothetical protein